MKHGTKNGEYIVTAEEIVKLINIGERYALMDTSGTFDGVVNPENSQYTVEGLLKPEYVSYQPDMGDCPPLEWMIYQASILLEDATQDEINRMQHVSMDELDALYEEMDKLEACPGGIDSDRMLRLEKRVKFLELCIHMGADC